MTDEAESTELAELSELELADERTAAEVALDLPDDNDAGSLTAAEAVEVMDTASKGRDILVEVKTDDQGNGTGLVGLDWENISDIRLINAKGKVDAEAAHTTAIARVIVSGSNVYEGTVLVAVTPK